MKELINIAYGLLIITLLLDKVLKIDFEWFGLLYLTVVVIFGYLIYKNK